MCNLCWCGVARGAAADKCRVNLVMKRATRESWHASRRLSAVHASVIDAQREDVKQTAEVS